MADDREAVHGLAHYGAGQDSSAERWAQTPDRSQEVAAPTTGQANAPTTENSNV